MIITCNCGEKKFTLPDNSIPAAGRMVQCGFCGIKWKQFPVGEVEKTQSIPLEKIVVSKPQPIKQKIEKSKKVKRTAPKKPREISLYSPEYLAKKHGIRINDTQSVKNISKKEKGKVSFGFYNSLILFIFLAIFLARILYFAKDFIINKIPVTEFYLNYFFESIRNVFEIIRDLLIIY